MSFINTLLRTGQLLRADPVLRLQHHPYLRPAFQLFEQRQYEWVLQKELDKARTRYRKANPTDSELNGLDEASWRATYAQEKPYNAPTIVRFDVKGSPGKWSVDCTKPGVLQNAALPIEDVLAPRLTLPISQKENSGGFFMWLGGDLFNPKSLLATRQFWDNLRMLEPGRYALTATDQKNKYWFNLLFDPQNGRSRRDLSLVESVMNPGDTLFSNWDALLPHAKANHIILFDYPDYQLWHQTPQLNTVMDIMLDARTVPVEGGYVGVIDSYLNGHLTTNLKLPDFDPRRRGDLLVFPTREDVESFFFGRSLYAAPRQYALSNKAMIKRSLLPTAASLTTGKLRSLLSPDRSLYNKVDYLLNLREENEEDNADLEDVFTILDQITVVLQNKGSQVDSDIQVWSDVSLTTLRSSNTKLRHGRDEVWREPRFDAIRPRLKPGETDVPLETNAREVLLELFPRMPAATLLNLLRDLALDEFSYQEPLTHILLQRAQSRVPDDGGSPTSFTNIKAFLHDTYQVAVLLKRQQTPYLLLSTMQDNPFYKAGMAFGQLVKPRPKSRPTLTTFSRQQIAGKLTRATSDASSVMQLTTEYMERLTLANGVKTQARKELADVVAHLTVLPPNEWQQSAFGFGFFSAYYKPYEASSQE